MKKRIVIWVAAVVLVYVAAHLIIKRFEPNASLHETPLRQPSHPDPFQESTSTETVDYLTKINQELAANITNESNAVVALIKLFPAGMVNEDPDCSLVVRKLDVTPEEVLKPYNLIRHLVRESYKLQALFQINSDSIDDRIKYESYRVTSPWKSATLPAWAKALQIESEKIDQLVAASMKREYYHPIFSFVLPLGEALPQSVISRFARDASFDLVYRAMNSIAENRIDHAIEDIKALRRLTKLTSKPPFIPDKLIPISIFYSVSTCETHLLENLSREQLANYIEFAEAFPFPVDFQSRIDCGTRVAIKDTVQTVFTSGSTIDEGLTQALRNESDNGQEFVRDLFRDVFARPDLTQASNAADEIMDGFVKALQKPALSAQRQSYEQHFEAFLAESDRLMDELSFGVPGPQHDENYWLAYFVVSVNHTLYDPHVLQSEFKSKIQDQVNQIAMRIQLSFLDSGTYPESPASLAAPGLERYSFCVQKDGNWIPVVQLRSGWS